VSRPAAAKIEKPVDRGPFFNQDGTVAVDGLKYPTLRRALERSRPAREGWAKVVELRLAHEEDAADRLVRKLLGVQGPPMSEETKEKLREYNETHKEEIKERKEQKLEVRRRTIALLSTGTRRRKA
jgi:hypothetical protein